LTDNHFYFTLLGELYGGIDDEKAVRNLRQALALARTESDRQAIRKKLDSLG
jgi:predicted RNA polymerase sigma factor